MRRVLRIVRQARPDAWLAAIVAACVFASGSERRPSVSSDAPEPVRASATAETPDADGNQRVNVILHIASDWHVFANPTESTLATATPTAITVRSERIALTAQVEYPQGELVHDDDFGDYRVYTGQVTIPAVVKRSGTGAPLTVEIRFQACNDKQKRCLTPTTITVNVPETRP